MDRHAAAGRTVATAATANHVGAQLWNPSSSASIYVYEIHWVKTVATVDNLSIQRSSTRGATPTATVTPDADNEFEGGTTSPTATVLELATFGTQPTLATPALLRWNLPAAIGAGLMWVFSTPIRVRPGTGLCVATPVAVILQPADVAFVWEE